MGTIKTKGIIIAENNMGDFDKMLTMLTPGMGKISCAAKGARRPKSLLLAGTQFLCFADCLLYKGSGSYHINSVEPIEIFYPIRTDLDKLTYASSITKMVLDVTTENQNSYKILQLFLNTLYTISELEKDLDFVLAVFKLRLLCLLGFAPNIRECGNCRQKENLTHFSLKDSSLKCESCSKQDTSCISLQPGSIIAMQYIVSAPAKKLFSFQLSKEVTKELVLVAKLYTTEKLEKEYKLEDLF